MDLKINNKTKLSGTINIPGDKSISHRALILGSLAEGKSRISGLLKADDCLKTLEIMRSLGVKIDKKKDEYQIDGIGLTGLKEPSDILDCGNSGTAMRLLTGLLSGQNFYSVLTGDSSLRKRPMKRIVTPLLKMGAKILMRKDGKAPLSINGNKLQGLNYKMPVASAQVKSSLLLAGLYTDEKTVIEEPAQSRDHTERMLMAAGIDLKKEGKLIKLKANKKRELKPLMIEIPGDISSATFFITAALIIPKSRLLLKNIGINPTRSGFLEIVEKMGGNIKFINKREASGEPIADLLIKKSELKGVEISGNIIPRLIDEIPIIAVLASQAEGKTIIKDAAELRVKETDRIKAITAEFEKLGIDIEELADGMIINGPQKIKGGIEVKSHHDHRIAMALAILGLKTENGLRVKNSEAINTSFPQFEGLLKKI